MLSDIFVEKWNKLKHELFELSRNTTFFQFENVEVNINGVKVEGITDIYFDSENLVFNIQFSDSYYNKEFSIDFKDIKYIEINKKVIYKEVE